MKPEFLFEVSWEVCNKVGGIYTVISSKAAQMVAHYAGAYVAVGPFFSTDTVKGEFEELPIPQLYKKVNDQMAGEGIGLHWGTWLIPGSPKALLVDFSECLGKADDIKRQLWDAYAIDSWGSGDDITYPFVWAWSAGKVLEAFAKQTASKAIVAHFHEWLAGTGLLYITQKQCGIKTVFTTHATVVGRALAESGVALYDTIKDINADKEAYAHGVGTKHLTEKAAATHSDMLTTVSEITGLEVKYFLGRDADALLPNGLDITKYPTIEEIVLQHRIARDRMREFLLYYFLPYYALNVEDTLFYFLSGRYEIKNKGIDVFISALGALNEVLKKTSNTKTIIVFLFIPTGVKSIHPEIIENREWFRDMQRALEEVNDTVLSNVMYHSLEGTPLTLASLFGKDRAEAFEIKKKKFTRGGNPPVCTYDVVDKNDAIINLLARAGLQNSAEDNVKVIYYPTYLNGGDGLLNLDYREIVEGSHFGVFPSLYEPWGYTPLETAALGVASLTSDVSGFGQFIGELRKDGTIAPEKNKSAQGIYVLKRKGKSYQEATDDLAAMMLSYAKFSREERVDNKVAAKSISEFADWKYLVNHYFSIHERALGI